VSNYYFFFHLNLFYVNCIYNQVSYFEFFFSSKYEAFQKE